MRNATGAFRKVGGPCDRRFRSCSKVVGLSKAARRRRCQVGNPPGLRTAPALAVNPHRGRGKPSQVSIACRAGQTPEVCSWP